MTNLATLITTATLLLLATSAHAQNCDYWCQQRQISNYDFQQGLLRNQMQLDAYRLEQQRYWQQRELLDQIRRNRWNDED